MTNRPPRRRRGLKKSAPALYLSARGCGYNSRVKQEYNEQRKEEALFRLPEISSVDSANRELRRQQFTERE